MKNFYVHKNYGAGVTLLFNKGMLFWFLSLSRTKK